MNALDTTLVADPAQVVAITQDVFAALIDDGEMLVSQVDVPPAILDPVTSWVDMTRADSPFGVRTLVRAEREAANTVVRGLLRMDADEVVGDEDLVDAFGEIANVVGGNLKSLLPEHAVLSLPRVEPEPPVLDPARLLAEVGIEWRGLGLVVSLWALS